MNRPHYEIRPFAPQEAEIVASWAASSDIRRELDGGELSLTADDIALWSYEANWIFTLRREGDIVAYGEIVEDDVEKDIEIQHLLVAPDSRNQGIGKAFISLLMSFIQSTRPDQETWIRSGRHNFAMIACAKGANFVEAPEMSGQRFVWLKYQ